jgi:hypothetical protein
MYKKLAAFLGLLGLIGWSNSQTSDHKLMKNLNLHADTSIDVP